MPPLVVSPLHEILVELLRRSPELLCTLIGDRLDPLRRSDLRFETDLTRATQLIEVDADLVLKIFAPDGTLLCGLILEVQLRKRASKARTWPLYAAWAHYRLGCPIYVIVVAVDEETAQWAAGPFCVGDMELRPWVIGPEHIRPILGREEARKAVELTFLSGLVHRHEPVALQIGLNLWKVLDESDHDLAHLIWDVYLGNVDQAVRRALEMELHGWKPQSDWGKRLYADGRQEGRQEGRLEGKAEALLAVLLSRGIRTTSAQQQRVLSCRDEPRIRAWLERAGTVATAAELFDDA